MSISKKVSKTIEHKKIEVIFTNERLITPSGMPINSYKQPIIWIQDKNSKGVINFC